MCQKRPTHRSKQRRYSITSSARASSVAGIVRPSVLALLRLTSHVAGLMFQKAIGTNFTMVPYRGAGESAQALIAEQIDVVLVTAAISVGQMRAGSIKVYAVMPLRSH